MSDIKYGLCDSAKVERHLDIGWDIWEGGEERQHVDLCLNCGAKRYWCDYTSYTGPEDRTMYGEWAADVPSASVEGE